MSEYSELSREDLIALVTHYESLTDELITRMMDTETFSAEDDESEMTPFEAKMMKILQFYIRYSASNSRSRAWGGLFSDFGFKSTIQFARWGSSYQSPVQVKGAKEIVEVFSGEADAEILREVGISPKSLFASIRWKK
jgi:hypothetical protein